MQRPSPVRDHLVDDADLMVVGVDQHEHRGSGYVVGRIVRHSVRA
jgi:hypothetical protein